MANRLTLSIELAGYENKWQEYPPTANELESKILRELVLTSLNGQFSRNGKNASQVE
jgi:hypothetical protein